jgi:protein arginine kinase activator
MKCDLCNRPATVHITEIVDGKPHEYHLCDEHAREQLTRGESSSPPAKPSKPKEYMAALAAAPSKGELHRLDKQTCPVCGISFREFRSAGRLGCAYDYEAFREELIPLIENIHGEVQHCGKVPKRAPTDYARISELAQLRQALKRAIEAEDYEEAARLRDKIRALEK